MQKGRATMWRRPWNFVFCQITVMSDHRDVRSL
jgi:hypothetical protein